MTILDAIYFILLAAATLSYLVRNTKGDRYKRPLLLDLVLLLVTSVLSIGLLSITGIRNNLFLFHIFTPVQYALLSWMYYGLIEDKQVKKLILLSIPVFLSASILFALFVQGPREYNSFISLFTSIALICWPLIFLRETLILQHVDRLLRFPPFWISIGLLFYFVGTVVLEGIMSYMIKHNRGLAQQVFLLTYIFKYLLFVLLTIGAWCGGRSDA